MDHGAWDEARAGYDALAPQSERPSDLRYLALRLAMLDEAEGQHEEALRGYAALWDGPEDDELDARAAWLAGRLLRDELGRPDEAARLWEELVTSQPEHVGADRALDALLLDLQDEPVEALALLSRLYDAVGDSKLGDNVLYARAKRLRGLGRATEEEETLAALVERHPHSGLRYEARWGLAELRAQAGDLAGALLQLRLIAEDQDESWKIGIYESDLADDAQLWRGILRAERGGDLAGAHEEFERLLLEHPTSTLRDDARWNLAWAALRAGDTPQAKAQCRALRQEEPASRWARRCAQLEADQAPDKRGWSTSGAHPFDGLTLAHTAHLGEAPP
jgi:tetratricopeptide (TPR) repeat protein